MNRDIPIKSKTEDQFSVQKHVDALSDFISNSDTPITIAIQGEWGSGKTSFMHMVEEKLCDSSMPDDKRFDSIWVNAWARFMGEKPELAVKNVIGEVLRQMGNHFEELARKNDRKKNMKKVLTGFRTTAFMMLKMFHIGVEWDDAKDFMDAVKDSGSTTLEKSKRNFEEFVTKQIEEENGYSKKGILIFVDDLDRLNPEVAVSILDALKNVFDINKCIFVISIDSDVIKSGVRKKMKIYESNNRNLEQDYFDKLIQLPYVLPVEHYVINDMVMDFLKTIDFIDSDEYNQDIVRVIELSTHKNPRAIKRLFNMISLVNLLHFSEGIADDNDVKILELILMAIQIMDPSIYASIIKTENLANWNLKNVVLTRSLLTEEEKDRNGIDHPWKEVIYSYCLEERTQRGKYASYCELLDIYDSYYNICSNKGHSFPEILGLVNAVYHGEGGAEIIRYDGIAYDRHSETQFAQGNRLIKSIDLSDVNNVLDIGCGNGKTTIELLNYMPSMKIKAIDISESQIKVAKEKYESFMESNRRKVSGAIDFEVCDALNIKEKEKFDLVFSNSSLHWILNAEKIYKIIYEAIKVGGKIAVHTGGKGTYEELHKRVRLAAKNVGVGDKLEAFKFPAFYPDKAEMESLLEKVGFKNITIDEVVNIDTRNSTLVKDFAAASMIFYKQAGLSDEEYKLLEEEYYKLCESNRPETKVVRLYIYADKTGPE